METKYEKLGINLMLLAFCVSAVDEKLELYCGEQTSEEFHLVLTFLEVHISHRRDLRINQQLENETEVRDLFFIMDVSHNTQEAVFLHQCLYNRSMWQLFYNVKKTTPRFGALETMNLFRVCTLMSNCYFVEAMFQELQGFIYQKYQ